LTDSVAVDAKRILLRYGAPIAILDKVSEPHRIEFAREIAKTLLPDREHRLRELLAEHGYADAAFVNRKGRTKKGRAPVQPDARPGSSTPEVGETAGKPKAAAKDKAGAPKSAAKAKVGKARVAATAKVPSKGKAPAKAPRAKAGAKRGAARDGKPRAPRKKR
jgi:hypothetical protein